MVGRHPCLLVLACCWLPPRSFLYTSMLLQGIGTHGCRAAIGYAKVTVSVTSERLGFTSVVRDNSVLVPKHSFIATYKPKPMP